MLKEETPEEKPDWEKVIGWIDDILENGEGLQREILTWAFLYLKRNPNSTIEEALNYGIDEWIK